MLMELYLYDQVRTSATCMFLFSVLAEDAALYPNFFQILFIIYISFGSLRLFQFLL